MINPSHYVSVAHQSASVSALPLRQGEKRYLRDFPDSSKTQDPKRALTHVTDSSGYVLVVPDEIADRLVLEDPSETRLQQLARRCALSLECLERHTLYKQIVNEFGPEQAKEAMDAAFAEEKSLYSSERRQWASDMLESIRLRGELIRTRDEIQRQWDLVSHTDSNGVRRLNGGVTFRDVCTFVGSELSTCLREKCQTIKSVMFVSASFFFVFFIRDGDRCGNLSFSSVC